MNREYSNGTFNDIQFFTGIEIEKTPAFGMKTLFVVGIQNIKDISYHANIAQARHIYLGANQSFNMPLDADAYTAIADWSIMVQNCLDKYFTVTLDFDLKYVDLLAGKGFMDHHNFIPQISVKIPNIRKLNYNTTVKIDDIGFKATNPGIWCTSLHELQSKSSFTPWSQYEKDELI